MRITVFLILILGFISSETHALHCFGTEPFWSARIDDDFLSFELMGEARTSYQFDQITAPKGRLQKYISLYFDKDRPRALIQKTECNDGMSDHTYLYQAFLFLDSASYVGCCRLIK